MVVEKAAVFSVLSSNHGVLILLKSSQAGVESVDGQPGHGVVGGVVLGLADGLHPAGLVLDVHVVEGHVEEVNAIEETSHSGEERVLEAPALVVVIVVGGIIVVGLVVARVVVSTGLMVVLVLPLVRHSPVTCTGQT